MQLAYRGIRRVVHGEGGDYPGGPVRVCELEHVLGRFFVTARRGRQQRRGNGEVPQTSGGRLEAATVLAVRRGAVAQPGRGGVEVGSLIECFG